MNLKYKKSKLVESMGYDIVFPASYGTKPQSIKLTESQFKRLVESYMEVEDETLAEINETFGDGDIGGLTGHETDANLDGPEDFNTASGYDLPEDAILDELSDEEEILETSRDSEGEYRGAPSKVEKRDTYDGRPGKVIGVYDDNLDKKSREGEVYEDTGNEESYHYGAMLNKDAARLHDLKKHGASRSHIRNLEKDMDYDDKRGVGKDDKWRDLAGSHFYHDK